MNFSYRNYDYCYNGYTVTSHKVQETVSGATVYGSILDHVVRNGTTYVVVRRFKIIKGDAVPSDWENNKPAVAMYSNDLRKCYKCKSCRDGVWRKLKKEELVGAEF